MLQRFHTLLVESVDPRLGLVVNEFMPDLREPAPAWPATATDHVEWLNRDDILSPAAAFEDHVVLVVSNPQRKAGTLQVLTDPAGPMVAESSMEVQDHGGFVTLPVSRARQTLRFVFRSGYQTRELGRIPPLVRGAMLEPHLRLLFSPCQLAVRSDVKPEISLASARFNQAVEAHLSRHAFDLGMAHPVVTGDDPDELTQAVCSNVLATLHNDAFVAWAGEEAPVDSEVTKAAVIDVWTGQIAFEGYFDITPPEHFQQVVNAFCQRCEAVLHREFPAFVSRIDALVPQGGELAAPSWGHVRVGVNLSVYRSGKNGVELVMRPKVRRVDGSRLEAWETERLSPGSLAVGDVVATDWTDPAAVAAALAPSAE